MNEPSRQPAVVAVSLKGALETNREVFGRASRILQGEPPYTPEQILDLQIALVEAEHLSEPKGD
jgi:hypothetical protein